MKFEVTLDGKSLMYLYVKEAITHGDIVYYFCTKEIINYFNTMVIPRNYIGIEEPASASIIKIIYRNSYVVTKNIKENTHKLIKMIEVAADELDRVGIVEVIDGK